MNMLWKWIPFGLRKGRQSYKYILQNESNINKRNIRVIKNIYMFVDLDYSNANKFRLRFPLHFIYLENDTLW